MTPVQRAAAVYDREPCARSFKEDLEAHLIYGLVVSTPDLFLMARPVSHDAPRYEIVNPWCNVWDSGEPDCWHLYLYAGDMLSAFQQATYELPYVSFERKNRLRVYRREVIYAACSRHLIVS
jgi:hypothetical protein